MEARAAGGLSAFVGREREQEILAKAAEDVRRGVPRVITIEGEPGCGKSRLIHGALAEEAFRGWEFWRCDAEATLRNVAWSVARKLLVAALKAGGQTNFEALRDRLCETGGLNGDTERLAASTLLGARIDNAGWGETQPEHRRNLIHAVFVRTLQQIAGAAEHPVALVIEDLQWIDSELLAALTMLARAANKTTFLLLSTRRPAEERLAMPDTETRILLALLAAAEAGLLVDDLLGAQPPRAIETEDHQSYGRQSVVHRGNRPAFDCRGRSRRRRGKGSAREPAKGNRPAADGSVRDRRPHRRAVRTGPRPFASGLDIRRRRRAGGGMRSRRSPDRSAVGRVPRVGAQRLLAR